MSVGRLLGVSVLVVAGAAAFLFAPGRQKQDSTTETTSVAEVVKPKRDLTETSSGTAPTATVADTKEPEASESPQEQERDIPDTLSTPDPNDEPDNTLAGISYRDVQMWEIAELGLPEKVKGGVLISKVHAKSSFAESQIRPGDIVTHAHHSKIINFDDLSNAVTGRSHSLLDVYRDGKPFQVVLNKPYRK